MTQPGQMVNFPGEGSGYEDSGEGGLFVMMVVTRPPDWTDNCNVDVIADLRISSPDVCVSPERRLLWEPWDYRKGDHAKQSAAYRLLTGQNESDLASWTLRARNWDEFSVSLMAAVHLGSSCGSWCHPEESYWEATPDDLTDEGKSLWTGLSKAFGREPLLLTFLDT